MTAAELPSRFDIARVATRTFNIVSRNIVVFGALTVLLYVLPHIGGDIIDETTDHLPGSFSRLLFSGSDALYALAAAIGHVALVGALIRGTVADLNGERADIMACLKTGFRLFFPVLGVSLVVFLGVLLGLIALVIPGLMLLTAWLVAVPAVAIEREGVREGLARSTELTRGHRWPIFGLIAIFCIGAAIVGGAIRHAEDAAAHVIGFLPGMDVNPTSHLFGGLVALVATVGMVAIYYELRAIKEDAGPNDLAAILD